MENLGKNLFYHRQKIKMEKNWQKFVLSQTKDNIDKYGKIWQKFVLSQTKIDIDKNGKSWQKFVLSQTKNKHRKKLVEICFIID